MPDDRASLREGGSDLVVAGSDGGDLVVAGSDGPGEQSEAPGSVCQVVHEEQVGELHLSREIAERLLAGGRFFWLDLHRPTQEDFAVLRDVFEFHPLALEDSEHFGQRAKLDDYDDFVFLVVYGAVPDEDRLVEVHCFYSERFLITVHRDEAPAFTEVRHRYQKRQGADRRPGAAALPDHRRPWSTASSRSWLTSTTGSTSSRTRSSCTRATSSCRRSSRMKRLLVGMRKAVTPQRDLFASLMGGVAELPGMTTEDERYFRDIYDHLIRISDLIDTYRDLLTSSMDVFLSTVSNRLNVVMKQLAVIATIFLPLTFITGFFGQNFGWLVRHIGGWPAFVGLGIGTEIVAVAILVTFFKRRGWF